MTDTADNLAEDAVAGPYWSALAEGRMVVCTCEACGNLFLPPRSECPRCLASELGWREVSGNGRLISWVVYRRSMHPSTADRVPYNVAIVELEEGPRVITNIVNTPLEQLRGDAPVRLVISEHDGLSLPLFEQVAE